jgi:hypothetical protein
MSDISFHQTHLYALPGSKIYHKVISVSSDQAPWFACSWVQIHDLMTTRLAAGLTLEPDQYGHRRCKRCFK